MTIHLEWTPNRFADLQFYVHNAELLLNDGFKPNVDDYFRSTNRCAPAVGWRVGFCSCVQGVLTIGHSLPEKVYIVPLAVQSPRWISSGLFSKQSRPGSYPGPDPSRLISPTQYHSPVPAIRRTTLEAIAADRRYLKHTETRSRSSVGTPPDLSTAHYRVDRHWRNVFRKIA